MAARMSSSVLGRPPNLPFRCEAAAFALVEALPPAFPICAAIQRLDPRNPLDGPNHCRQGGPQSFLPAGATAERFPSRCRIGCALEDFTRRKAAAGAALPIATE